MLNICSCATKFGLYMWTQASFSGVTQTSWRLMSTATQTFVQQLVQAHNNEQSAGDRWIPPPHTHTHTHKESIMHGESVSMLWRHLAFFWPHIRCVFMNIYKLCSSIPRIYGQTIDFPLCYIFSLLTSISGDEDLIECGIGLLERQHSASENWMSWWRHQMETFSALLAICTGNSPVPGEFPAQRPVTRSFDVFFDLRLHKRLSKRS